MSDAPPPVVLSAAALADAESRYGCSRVVRFQDVDHEGNLYLPRALEYFHDVYAAHLASVGHPLHEVLAERRWAAPVVQASAHALGPLRFGDEVEVGIAVVVVDGSKVTHGYRVGRPGEPAGAVGQTVRVFVDPSTFRRALVPTDLGEAFAALGADPAR